ncbi:MAG: TIR domain-containing protein, partial [Anaerolineae bacterium]
MAETTFEYDLFISCQAGDAAWVEDWLLPRLPAGELRLCLNEGCFEPGAPRADEYERLVEASRKTLLVLSPAYLEEAWATYTGDLVKTLDPDARQRRLLPLLRRPCEVPLRLQALVCLDFSQPATEARELERLRAALGLAGAEAVEFPLDRLPEPGPLPPGSYCPLGRNPDFVGRRADLRQLARLLRPASGLAVVGQVAAATGMGGIGKSQLAVEYAYRYGRHYPGGVFWLDCQDPETLPLQVAAMGGRDENGGLGLAPDWYELDQAERVQRVRALWLAETPRLLIFDNAEEPAVVDEWRPRQGGCRLLVTSRRPDWPGEVERLPLATLPRPDSLRLLLGFRAARLGRPVEALIEAERAEAEAICHRLDDLPLALHLAGKYLEDPQALSLAAYRAELEARPVLSNEALVDWVRDGSPTRHVQNVAATFELSLQRLDPDDPVDGLALALYGRAGFFGPAAIDRELLLAAVDLPEGTPARRPADALARLAGLGLLELDAETGAPRLHRLLAEFARRTAPADLRDEAAEAVAGAVTDRVNAVVNAGLPAALTPALREHLGLALAEAGARKSKLAGGLYNALGRAL